MFFWGNFDSKDLKGFCVMFGSDIQIDKFRLTKLFYQQPGTVFFHSYRGALLHYKKQQSKLISLM